MSESTTTIDIGSIDISIEDSKPVERPYLGTITQDQYEEGRTAFPGESGVTWHLIVTPLGRDKGFHAWLPLKFKTEYEDGVPIYFDGHDADHGITYSMSGAFGRVLDSIRKIHGNKDANGDVLKPGHGQFDGITLWFVNRVQTYGVDKVTGELRGANGRPVPIALKKATAMEIAEAGGEGISSGAAVAYTDAEIAIALDILDGKKPIAYQRDVMKAELSAEVKSAILQGTMATWLVEAGLATKDGNVINRVAEVVAA